MSADTGRVYARKCFNYPLAECSRCGWRMTDLDPPKLRRQVRKHVLNCGGSVYVEPGFSYRYDYVPAIGGPGD